MATTLLYGGSFDPIHWGHLITAQSAMEQLAAAGVIFMPARVNPHKADHSPRADGLHRLAMIRLAISSEPRFTVSDLELNRLGPSYTIDTVESLCQARRISHCSSAKTNWPRFIHGTA